MNDDKNMLAIIEKVAVDPNVDVEKMQRLLDLQERIIDKNAEVEFHAAMAKLQSELPTITKKGAIEYRDRKTNQLVSTPYARFEDINETIKPILYSNGFSISFRSAFPEGKLEVTGILSHSGGHHVETSMLLPFDVTGSKNSVQAIGSSVSYGKRYVLSMLLNITTSGEDDDAQTAGIECISEDQQNEIHALVDNAHFSHESVLRHYKISDYNEIPARNFQVIMDEIKAKAKAKAK